MVPGWNLNDRASAHVRDRCDRERLEHLALQSRPSLQKTLWKGKPSNGEPDSCHLLGEIASAKLYLKFYLLCVPIPEKLGVFLNPT